MSGNNILSDQKDRAYVVFSAAFAPHVGFVGKLSSAAELVRKQIDNNYWVAGQNSYTFRDLKNRVLFVAQFNQIFIQTLGFGSWQKDCRSFSETANTVLSELEIKSLTRISLRIGAFLDLQMSHEEMVDLMYGSFLNDKEKLSTMSDDLFDAAAHLYGKRSNQRFRINVLPQTVEQVKQNFFLTPNLEHFTENKLIDDTIREFWRPISEKPSLFTDCEVYVEEEVDVSRLMSFMVESGEIAAKIIGDAVNLLESRVGRSKR